MYMMRRNKLTPSLIKEGSTSNGLIKAHSEITCFIRSGWCQTGGHHWESYVVRTIMRHMFLLLSADLFCYLIDAFRSWQTAMLWKNNYYLHRIVSLSEHYIPVLQGWSQCTEYDENIWPHFEGLSYTMAACFLLVAQSFQGENPTISQVGISGYR